MLSANLVNAISLLSLPTTHLIASPFAQTGMSAANPDQISNTGALLPPPLTHWIVCSVSYGPPMIAITPSNNFMWPGNDLMAHKTMIRGVASNKTIAGREMECVVRDIIAQSEFLVYCLNLPDEVRLFSTESYAGASCLGKVYISSGMQLA
jgi:hypothetical protein